MNPAIAPPLNEALGIEMLFGYLLDLAVRIARPLRGGVQAIQACPLRAVRSLWPPGAASHVETCHKLHSITRGCRFYPTGVGSASTPHPILVRCAGSADKCLSFLPIVLLLTVTAKVTPLLHRITPRRRPIPGGIWHFRRSRTCHSSLLHQVT